MEKIQRLLGQLEKAGKASPKQDPHYGKARRLAKKIGARIEVERRGVYGVNLWLSIDPEFHYKNKGNPWGDHMRLAEDWRHAHAMLLELENFKKSVDV